MSGSTGNCNGNPTRSTVVVVGSVVITGDDDSCRSVVVGRTLVVVVPEVDAPPEPPPQDTSTNASTGTSDRGRTGVDPTQRRHPIASTLPSIPGGRAPTAGAPKGQATPAKLSGSRTVRMRHRWSWRDSEGS